MTEAIASAETDRDRGDQCPDDTPRQRHGQVSPLHTNVETDAFMNNYVASCGITPSALEMGLFDTPAGPVTRTSRPRSGGESDTNVREK
jgi:hypothetical protein